MLECVWVSELLLLLLTDVMSFHVHCTATFCFTVKLCPLTKSESVTDSDSLASTSHDEQVDLRNSFVDQVDSI